MIRSSADVGYRCFSRRGHSYCSQFFIFLLRLGKKTISLQSLVKGSKFLDLPRWQDCTKMKFSIKDFFSKCDQIHSFLRIWLHLLKKSLIRNFITFLERCRVLVHIWDLLFKTCKRLPMKLPHTVTSIRKFMQASCIS